MKKIEGSPKSLKQLLQNTKYFLPTILRMICFCIFVIAGGEGVLH